MSESGSSSDATTLPLIVVVDDEAPILSSVRRALTFEPWQVLTCADGEQALEILRTREAAVLLSDQHMPRLDGVDLLRRARELSPDTTRVLFSGHIDLDLLRSAVNGGEVYRFITKPWDNDTLVTVIRHSIDRWHLVRQNRRLRDQAERQNRDLLRLNAALESLIQRRDQDLDRRGQALELSQDVLDRLPVAVVGLDPQLTVALINRLASVAFPTLVPGEGLPAGCEALAACARARLAGVDDGDGVISSAIGPLRLDAVTLTDRSRCRGVVLTGIPDAAPWPVADL
jgi:response regulator RpfG family c-di-GMP phosphodiesterase